MSPGVLYQLAVHLDPALAALELRQFSAIYVLPARRQLTAEAVQSRSRRHAGGGDARPESKHAGGGGRQEPRSRAATAAADVAVADVAVAGAPAGASRTARSRPGSSAPPRAAEPAAVVALSPRTAAEPASGSTGVARRVRAALLAFAADLAAAQERGELVRVLSRVDDYVDRIAANGTPAS